MTPIVTPTGKPIAQSHQSLDPAAILNQYRDAVDRRMESAIVHFANDSWMRNALAYHLGWLDSSFEPEYDRTTAGGKRIRPALAMLCFESASSRFGGGGGVTYTGASYSDALTMGAALELFHNYSLIHDDIEDQDVLRRGRETLWALFGQAKAINAGDCLHALAFSCLGQLADSPLNAAVINQLLTTLMRCSVHLTLGQHADLSFEEELLVSTDRYLKMVRGKTAALLSTATYSGAVLALGLDPRFRDTLEAYAQLGYQLGMAFQIWDDGLGIWGVTGKTGKLSGSDIRRRKKSLPILYALEETTGQTRETLIDIYAHTTDPVTPEQEWFVKEALDSVDAKQHVYSQAEHYKQQAINTLTKLAGSPRMVANDPYFSQLREIVLFMTERSH